MYRLFLRNTFLTKYWPVVPLFLVVGVIYYCKNPKIASDYQEVDTLATHKNGEGFVGGTSCKGCHAAFYESHVSTAHFNSSALADSLSIKGDFTTGLNTYVLNDRARFTMIATDSGYFQHANFIHNQLELFYLSMDVVVGSGTKGQSFLHWKEGQLFQLQSSYFAPTGSWTPSPGVDVLQAPKRVNARCLECHATYAEYSGVSENGTSFEKDGMVYGIDCERCHGPSAKHVGYHLKNPEIKDAKYVLAYGSLSRQQRLDACALCHSGSRKPLKNPFDFLVGDDLTEFLAVETPTSRIPLDVHGNQYELLTQSECFKQSEMDCTTCHNPHKKERGMHSLFNQKCMACHQKALLSCKEDAEGTLAAGNNCIACHMPLLPSSSMVMQLDGQKTAVQVRTHFIAKRHEGAATTIE